MTFDDAIAAYARAYAMALRGPEPGTVAALMRGYVETGTGRDQVLRYLLPHLPPEIQKVWR